MFWKNVRENYRPTLQGYKDQTRARKASSSASSSFFFSLWDPTFFFLTTWDLNMTGLPVFFMTGACALSSDLCTRLSCSLFCCSSFSSLALCLRYFSLAFSACSTNSVGIVSMIEKYSSSLASMLVNICSVLREASLSKPHRT